MEHILIGGDYVPNGFGGVRQADGTQALLARALFRLSCRRASFPFLPELGSRLWQLKGRGAEEVVPLATAYCAEALAPLGLKVLGVTLLSQKAEHMRLDVQLAVGRLTEHVEVEL